VSRKKIDFRIFTSLSGKNRKEEERNINASVERKLASINRKVKKKKKICVKNY
jgi:hypothetical protein